MYRIELSPGEETAFRSIEEMAVAIRRGVVTPRARIYHNATNKWLPIQFHPHHKMAVEMPLTQAALVAGPPVKALSTLTLAPPVEREPPRPAAAEPEEPAPPKRSRKRKQPRRSLRLALLGALLIAGTHLALSGEPGQHTDSSPKPRSHRRLVSAQSGQAKSEISSTAVASDLPQGSVPTASQILAQSRAITAKVNATAARLGATAKPGAHAPAPKPDPAAPAPEPSVILGSGVPETPDSIEPAPSAIEISAPNVVSPESLTPGMVDSTSKKTLKHILHAIDGSPAKESAKPKH